METLLASLPTDDDGWQHEAAFSASLAIIPAWFFVTTA